MYFLFQLEEPVLLLGADRFAGVDIRVRVKGGGHVAQVYGKNCCWSSSKFVVEFAGDFRENRVVLLGTGFSVAVAFLCFHLRKENGQGSRSVNTVGVKWLGFH